MKKSAAELKAPLPDNPHCLVRTVAEAFAEEPALEAVKIDRARRSISVATLGRPDSKEIERVVASRIEEAQRQDIEPRCRLLEGAPDCSTCPSPAPLEVGRSLTIQQDAESTTISRVTCPTAPSFWRWRNVPWPKIVPREVSLPDEDDHEHEWKWQLLAAMLCGVLGLAAWLCRAS